jgi:anti-sigma regulatory factor (Ser/Thr protein kinase)
MDVGTASGRRSLGVVFAADATAPGRARRYVNRVLGTLFVPYETVEAALLSTSELVTNAVKYGRDARVQLMIGIEDSGTLRITVADRTPYAPLPQAVMAGELEESGRGLALVALLATKWGHERALGDGTQVWAEFVW